jgi:hypothetical protein
MGTANSTLRKFAALGTALGLAIAVAPASAVVPPTETFQLNVFSAVGLGGAGQSAGTVTLTQTDANDITIDVLLNSGFELVDTGSHNVLAYNVNIPVTVGTVTGTPTGYTLSNITSASESTFGTFSNGVSCSGGPGSADCTHPGSSTLTGLDLKVTATGITFANFVNDAAGYTVAVDMINNSGTCTASACTGPVAGTISAVPEPEIFAMMLPGLGLMGFVANRRRKRS